MKVGAGCGCRYKLGHLEQQRDRKGLISESFRGQVFLLGQPLRTLQ